MDRRQGKGVGVGLTLEGVQLWRLLKRRGGFVTPMKIETKTVRMATLEVSMDELTTIAAGAEALIRQRMDENGGNTDQVPPLLRTLSADMNAALKENL